MSDGLTRALEVVGERWALLVVREVALGLRRFDEVLSATGMPRAVLSDRLQRLTVAGILATRPYRMPGARARVEYVLTEAGFGLLPVLSALSDWGEAHLPPENAEGVSYRHTGCGGHVTVRMVCECGTPTAPHDGLIAQVDR